MSVLEELQFKYWQTTHMGNYASELIHYSKALESPIKLEKNRIRKVSGELSAAYGKCSVHHKSRFVFYTESLLHQLKLRSWAYFIHLEDLNESLFVSNLDFKVIITETKEKCISLLTSGNNDGSMQNFIQLYIAFRKLIAPLEDIERKLLDNAIKDELSGLGSLNWSVLPSLETITDTVNNLTSFYNISPKKLSGNDYFVINLAINSSFKSLAARDLYENLTLYSDIDTSSKRWWSYFTDFFAAIEVTLPKEDAESNRPHAYSYIKQLRILAEMTIHLEERTSESVRTKILDSVLAELGQQVFPE